MSYTLFDQTIYKMKNYLNKFSLLINNENSINFIALAPDFEIEISNFKDLDKKDLDVRARKLKG